ncbi:DUF3426 domain-containing protein [Acinetobacter stercoris]|uniref:Zinc finger/thioredoxin putative domain-containing protein n=1 Tax=Acinetobacter stercoris TaxID=2126983 RepID=A0A2U3MZK4_9GAMM|nr:MULTISPECIES: DUF3426 domain-containing protein [Acinetobacter]SPL70824.1 hypothetical protein KPC_2002 [Acinetobacter stercoris]
MSHKQTQCPNCHTVYKVSVPQLTVAQGMVCCPKCNQTFNALSHLRNFQTDAESPKKENIQDISPSSSSLEHDPVSKTRPEAQVLDIFNRKIENSNIDLQTYLNNLNYFNHEPVTALPCLNLSGSSTRYSRIEEKRKRLYYTFWILLNLTLIIVLIYQILWFNPQLLDRSNVLNHTFTSTTQLLNVDTVPARYKNITASQIKIEYNDQQTEFSGILTNTYPSSLKMPNLRLSLMLKGHIIKRYIIHPSEYLIPSLQGIERIPNNSPFFFQFHIDIEKNGFDHYQLDVIHP